MTVCGIANIDLDSSVGGRAVTSNQGSRVQTQVQSNFLCSTEINMKPDSFTLLTFPCQTKQVGHLMHEIQDSVVGVGTRFTIQHVTPGTRPLEGMLCNEDFSSQIRALYQLRTLAHCTEISFRFDICTVVR